MLGSSNLKRNIFLRFFKNIVLFSIHFVCNDERNFVLTLFAQIFFNSSFSNLKIDLLSILYPHFCAKWSKMMFKILKFHQKYSKLVIKTQDSYPLHLTSFLGPEIFKRKLTVCIALKAISRFCPSFLLPSFFPSTQYQNAAC